MTTGAFSPMVRERLTWWQRLVERVLHCTLMVNVSTGERYYDHSVRGGSW